MERRAVAALGFTLCAVGQPGAARAQAGSRRPDPPARVDARLDELGTLERRALEQALAARGLSLDPAPAGKIVRRVHVVNLPVFGPDDGFLSWFNVFHVTSRDEAVRREVLIQPGDPWDEERVAETRRNLRDPLFTSVVVIAPVQPGGAAAGQAAGGVDLLVVTRDVWSLRTNLRWEIQERVLTEFSMSLSENNLLGRRKQVAVVFDMDLGAYSIGPRYIDSNIAGSHLTLFTEVAAVFNRDSSELEGSKSVTSLSYPLWSLQREWGAGLEVTHFDAVRRSFLGTDLRGFETVEGVVVPWEYDERDLEIETTAVRQLGRAIKHRVAAGHRLDVQRPSVRDDFPGDEAARAEFEREVLPRSERSSLLFARYSMFTPVYSVYRNFDTFDLAEDRRLGPELIAEIGSAMKPIGSEVNFLTGSLSGSWTFDVVRDGALRLSASTSARRQDGDFIDISRTASIQLTTPVLLSSRLAARLAWTRRYDETNNRYYTIGGDSGLRGYTIGAFAGTGPHPVRVVANLELRTLSLPILFTRLGVVVFWDGGHAANCYTGCANQLVLHQDVGFGGRLLIPQLQPYVFRFDWAVPLTGPTAGLPGRFIAGVQQIF
jgi:hypothetical protein